MKTNVRVVGVALLLGAFGCGDDDAGGVDAGGDAFAEDAFVPDAGPSCTELLWDPTDSEITMWPDPSMLVTSTETDTGFALTFDEVRFADSLTRFGGYAPVFTEDLPELDGFGNNASAFIQFGRHFDVEMLPTAEETGSGTAGLGTVVLGDTPRIQPVLVDTTDDGRTLLLTPMQPLAERSWAASFVTRTLTDAARGCLEPSAAMQAVFDAPSVREMEAIDALVALGAIESAADLIALSVYPVQSLTADTREIAADIAARDYVPNLEVTCTDEEVFRSCELAFEAIDYRQEDKVIRRREGEPLVTTRRYTLPVSAWLPLEGEGPFPVMIWGSGLGSGRDQGRRLAAFAAPEGIATIAVDPVSHGEHPDVAEGESTETLNTVIRFFTIGSDLRVRAIRPLQLRDHWRQASYDKLQLVRLVQGGLDLDGDDAVDLDANRMSYLGVSLGGIMGVELLAATDAVRTGVLVVPGGRVGSIISDSSLFGTLITLLRPRGTTEGDVDRFFPILQTVIERGDAATYGPQVLQDRMVDDSRAPNVLAGVVLDDDTVPNPANYALMRAMRLPLVGPVLRPEPGIMGVPAPLLGNIDDGATTAGFLQFDVVRDGEMIEAATHNNIGDSEVGIEAWFHFLRTADAGDAEIADPYVAVGLEHGLPAEE